MPRRLKVFRTTAGFHDAYVAAPSRAAALRAWGATTDLFAMDAAEEVTDPELTAAPLAQPGEVIKQARGSDEEHLATASPTASTKAQPKSRSANRTKPRPSRADLDEAERRIKEAEANRAQQVHGFGDEQAALRKREDAARRAYEGQRSRLDAARAAEADAYEKKLAKWRVS